MNLLDSTNFEIFSKHVPKILRHQLINQLVEQYFSVKEYTISGVEQHQSDKVTTCNPSIQRFHGVLLFVDISGFTALSQKLNVDDLKNHINDYFTKMLNIVEKYGGEIM